MNTLTAGEIRRAERAHYLMQLSAYFSELVDLPGVRFAFTQRLTDTWYNQAYDIDWQDRSLRDLYPLIQEVCGSRNRAPCCYLTSACQPAELPAYFGSQDLVIFEEEAWMFFPAGEGSEPRPSELFIEIEDVSLGDNFDDFEQVYRNGLPGPEVDAYIGAVRDGLRYAPPGVDVHYLLGYIDGSAAGMLSVLSADRCSGIYAVATLEPYRRRGVARALTARAVRIASENQSEYIFLQTVKGDEGEEAFSRIGFQTLFTRTGYTVPEIAETAEHG